MAISIDRTGLEVSIGPFQFHLTPRMLGIVWDGRLDAMLERREWKWGWGKRSSKRGHFEAWAPGCYLSIYTGVGEVRPEGCGA